MKRSKRIDWEKNKRTKSAINTRLEKRDSQMEEKYFINCGQNALDIQWLESFLTYQLNDKHRDRVIASIAWLRDIPSRTLGGHGSSWRSFYARLAWLLRSGTYDPSGPGAEVAEKVARKVALWRHRRDEQRTAKARPAWMDDASLLPKRPPK